MKQTEFISLLAQTLRLEESTLKVAVRSLRECGLFTTGARGVNAPDMTAQDVIRTVVAVMMAAKVSRVGEEVGDILSLEARSVPWEASPEFHFMFERFKTLEQFLFAICEGELQRSEVEFLELEITDILEAKLTNSVEVYSISFLPLTAIEKWKQAIHSGEDFDRELSLPDIFKRSADQVIQRSARISVAVIFDLVRQIEGEGEVS